MARVFACNLNLKCVRVNLNVWQGGVYACLNSWSERGLLLKYETTDLNSLRVASRFAVYY